MKWYLAIKSLDGFASVQDASEASGFSKQYLRRLLRNGKISGWKIGQIWVVKIESIKKYTFDSEKLLDARFKDVNHKKDTFF